MLEVRDGTDWVSLQAWRRHAEIAIARSENLSRTTGMPASCTVCAGNIGIGAKMDC